jgi:hypothetical protein
MKFLKYIVFFFAGLCAIAFLLPKQVEVNRTIVIQAETEIVFDQVDELKNWENWSVWNVTDSNTVFQYSKNSKGIGAWYSWKSKAMGEGKLTIIKSQKNKQINTELDFYEQGKGAGKWIFTNQNDQTKVSWTYFANLGYNPLARWIGLLALDSMIGQSLDQSLQSLKTYCQNTELEKN